MTKFNLDGKIIELSDEDLSESLENDYKEIEKKQNFENTIEIEPINEDKIIINSEKDKDNNE